MEAPRNRLSFAAVGLCFWIAVSQVPRAARAAGPLDPVGKRHIPIGISNSLDSLKTFVEAEGGFSPGIGSYGVYFWVFDPDGDGLIAPTSDDVPCAYGLVDDRLLIPWSRWKAGAIDVRTEVCEVRRKHTQGNVYLAGARAQLTNTGDAHKRISLYVALRPLGPAGFDVRRLEVGPQGDALLADGHPALIAGVLPAAAGVLPTDTIGDVAARGEVPRANTATSDDGDCSGAMRFDLTIPAGRTETIGLVAPVLPGRRAVRHAWTARSHNYIDASVPQSDADGIDVPDAGLEYYRGLSADELFVQARDGWRQFNGRVTLELPDARWTDGFYVMLAHAGLCMNEGAADVAVLNYAVFNRDGMYIANMMQKAGLPKLSEAVIDYFLAHPFNGRPYPEADNPGQILWSIGQHWRLTGDRAWLERTYPSARKIAEMIRYYRTTSGPHWVGMNRLEHGDAVPEEKRQVLRPGRCDGFHPEYTEAFDIVGLRVVAEMAEALRHGEEARHWHDLAKRLFREYDERFGGDLGKSYGSYSVLWPCELYPFDKGEAHEQFRKIGRRELSHWRYFAPATAHQGLLAGNREAGYATVELHLDHPQMRRWYAFDEGGRSGSGGWHHLRTTWTHSKDAPDQNRAVAMPHGWAIAEVWLLLRDCLAHERADQLVLLGGVSPKWFTGPKPITIKHLPTYFGPLDMQWTATGQTAVLELGNRVRPPGGFVLRLPSSVRASVTIDGKPATRDVASDWLLPRGTETVEVELRPSE